MEAWIWSSAENLGYEHSCIPQQTLSWPGVRVAGSRSPKPHCVYSTGLGKLLKPAATPFFISCSLHTRNITPHIEVDGWIGPSNQASGGGGLVDQTRTTMSGVKRTALLQASRSSLILCAALPPMRMR